MFCIEDFDFRRLFAKARLFAERGTRSVGYCCQSISFLFFILLSLIVGSDGNACHGNLGHRNIE